MGALINLTGQTFGHLTVIERAGSLNAKAVWRCKCDCGKLTNVRSNDLRSDNTKSCGCKQGGNNVIHGHAARGNFHPLYGTWKNMRQRCSDPNHKDYRSYGAKGVTVAPQWASFTQFLDDVGERPDGMTLDRISPFGNYTPENVRWASRETQAKNTRRKRSLSGRAKMTIRAVVTHNQKVN